MKIKKKKKKKTICTGSEFKCRYILDMWDKRSFSTVTPSYYVVFFFRLYSFILVMAMLLTVVSRHFFFLFCCFQFHIGPAHFYEIFEIHYIFETCSFLNIGLFVCVVCVLFLLWNNNYRSGNGTVSTAVLFRQK